MTTAIEAGSTEPDEALTVDAQPAHEGNEAGIPGTATSLPSNAPGAYSQRELLFVEREAKGELSFKYIQNDGNIQNLEWCVLALQAQLNPRQTKSVI
jgi:hypothetical protein